MSEKAFTTTPMVDEQEWTIEFAYENLGDPKDVVSSDFARILELKYRLLKSALNDIASWKEGNEVTASFDEPNCARIARTALAQVE